MTHKYLHCHLRRRSVRRELRALHRAIDNLSVDDPRAAAELSAIERVWQS